jgi:hypothetical protein
MMLDKKNPDQRLDPVKEKKRLRELSDRLSRKLGQYRRDRMKPLVKIEEGRLRGRLSVTAVQGESQLDATWRGWDELLDACPDTHWASRCYCDPERYRKGRRTSRRLFLTMIYDPMDEPKTRD